MKKPILFLLMFPGAFLMAQSISGTVSGPGNKPVPFATVALLNAKDSLPFKGSHTDESGQYIFENISAGNYLIKITSVEFEDSSGNIFQLDSSAAYKHPEIILSPRENILKEVSVSAQKKTFEFKDGNITVNVENSPLALGNTVYDLLLRLPGVMIDNGTISLQGQPGVGVYIDDRQQQISGMQLIALLKSMNASTVEKIEIIKNPSAKYDAAGGAGIINIKTKKLKITGFSGSCGYTYSRGYGNQHMPDLSLNYKGKKLAFFSSFNLYQGYMKTTADLHKAIAYNGISSTLDSKSFETDEGYFGTGNLGLDWMPNAKNTLGFKFQAVPGFIVRTKKGNNAISDSDLGYDNLDYKRTVPNFFYLANYNLNYEHLFDTAGTKLKFSTDLYGPYFDIYKSAYQYHFTDHNKNDLLSPQQFSGTNRIALSILSSRLDFEKKISKTLNLESGIKISSQAINSDYTFSTKDQQTGMYIIDTTLTNQFTYREQIGAAYVSFQKEIKKINVQAGLRAENTNVNTVSQINDFKYSRQYFKLFPNLTINYNRSDKHNFSLSYNKRIYRPDYNSFNPYPAFSNLFSISRGNPYLLPQFSNNIAASHTFKNKFTNTVEYSRVQNPIRGQTLQVDSSKVTIFQSGNLQSSNELCYYIFFNTELKKWWALTLNLGAYYFDFKGKIDGADLSSSGTSFSGYINNQLILPKNFKVEISGWYCAPWLAGGFYHYKQRGAFNLGVKKTLLDDHLALSVSVYDLFFTNKTRAVVNFKNQNYHFEESYDTRRLNLSVVYTFGKLKIHQREIKSDEDAKARVKR
ncbi:MAG: TonB-dependent receptor [Bacteroidota bacterium]